MPISVDVKPEHKEIMDFFEKGIYPYKGNFIWLVTILMKIN